MFTSRGPDDGRRLRRDRHGRGMRGPLAVSGPLAPAGPPVARSRSQHFDDVVLEAVERVEHRFPDELAKIEFAVEDVPDPGHAAAVDGNVPLGEVVPARPDQPARIIVYRRPIELRTVGPAELAELVHDVVVEQVAELLGLPPGEVDPSYDDESD